MLAIMKGLFMNAIWMIPPAEIGGSVPSLLVDTGVFAKTVLLILFVISVVSWAIMWDRTRLYLKLNRKGTLARNDLRSRGLPVMLQNSAGYLPSVEGAILSRAKNFLAAGQNQSKPDGESGAGDAPKENGGTSMAFKGALERRALEEISEMEKYLVFLATTSSVAPFLGLLGTVWGIMSSFLSMGVQGTASIEVVGPGIAEALITTIAGLGAAIPALVGYNLLGRHVIRQETRTDLFISTVVESAETLFRSESAASSKVSYEKNPV